MSATAVKNSAVPQVEMSKQTKFSNFVKGRSPSNKKNEKLNVFVDHLQNVRTVKTVIRCLIWIMLKLDVDECITLFL